MFLIQHSRNYATIVRYYYSHRVMARKESIINCGQIHKLLPKSAAFNVARVQFKNDDKLSDDKTPRRQFQLSLWWRGKKFTQVAKHKLHLFTFSQRQLQEGVNRTSKPDSCGYIGQPRFMVKEPY